MNKTDHHTHGTQGELEFLNLPTMTTAAAIDRLVHHSVILELTSKIATAAVCPAHCASTRLFRLPVGATKSSAVAGFTRIDDPSVTARRQANLRERGPGGLLDPRDVTTEIRVVSNALAAIERPADDVADQHGGISEVCPRVDLLFRQV